MFRAQIKEEIRNIVGDDVAFSVERPENPAHGDYSSNAALILAKKAGKNPKEVAEELRSKLKLGFTEKMDIAGPGFLNFFISQKALAEHLSDEIFTSRLPVRLRLTLSPGAPTRVRAPKGAQPIKISSGKFLSKKINIEFVSANPTGPLTMANGRGGFYGDVLANILEASGQNVTREYYINDAGNQVRLLGESIEAAEGRRDEKEEYYKGAYIKKLKGKTAKQAAATLLKEIKSSLQKAGIKFDVWFSEDKNIHKSDALKKMLEFLVKKRLAREKEGALWVGDAVVIKSNKEPTYFLADLAYHYDKFIKRKFDICVDIWGADHHGYIERMKKGVEAVGVDSSRLRILILQMVRLISKGKEVRMSKRTGEFVTMDELLSEVGLDAARWFFLEKSLNTHMDFDLGLAKERSKKNPVYYVQYAHARACSILRNGKPDKKADLNLLTQPEELNLIKKILQLREVIEDIAGDYQAHRLPRYAYELSQTFTNFYEKHHVIDEKNKELTRARLALVSATKKTLSQTLGLMGISAPEKM